MPVRQYVGARYVPKFADPIEWNQQASYEALTIVTHLGASYTSKIPVPPGTEISNTDYWALTGNYNGQVEAYRQQVEALRTDVAGLEDTIEEYENFLGRLNGKHIVIIGDSTSDELVQAPNWVSRLRAAASDDTVIDNLSVNGCTCATGTLAATSVVDIVNSAANTLVGDIIILYIGTNDAMQSVPIGISWDSSVYGTGNFAGALTHIAAKIRQKNPTAEVFVVSPLKLYKSPAESTHIPGCSFDLYRRIMQTWCKWWGFGFLDGWSAPRYYCYPSNTFCQDGVHPTSQYSPILMRWICSHVNAGVGTPAIGRTLDLGVAAGGFLNNGIGAQNFSLKLLDNGMVRFASQISVENATGTYAEIGEVPEYLFPLEKDLWFNCTTTKAGVVRHDGAVNITTAGKINFVYGPSTIADGETTILGFICIEWPCMASGYIPNTDV